MHDMFSRFGRFHAAKNVGFDVSRPHFIRIYSRQTAFDFIVTEHQIALHAEIIPRKSGRYIEASESGEKNEDKKFYFRKWFSERTRFVVF